MYIHNALCILAAIMVSANGFMTPTPLSPRTVSRSATTLNMVAEDAKVVLVTGSSRGLGKAIALDIGAAGHKIVINFVSDSSKDSAEATVAEIKKSGGDAVAIQADSEYFFSLYWSSRLLRCNGRFLEIAALSLYFSETDRWLLPTEPRTTLLSNLF